MVSVADNGGLVMVTNLQGGEDWLNRLRAILNLIQCADASLVSRDDIFYAVYVAADMLPDEETANELWKAYREKYTR